MALGALTLTSSKTNKLGVKFDVISLVGAASYTAGGDTGLKAALRAATDDGREPVAVIDIGANGGYRTVYDYANEKVMHFQTDQVDDPQEESSTSNLSGIAFKLLVISI